jgi:hypothetical protein
LKRSQGLGVRIQFAAASRQLAASRTQRSEIRCRRSGVKLISDLRLLTSLMDDFNGLNDLNSLNHLTPCTMLYAI